MVNLPAAQDVFEFNNLNFDEDYSGVVWTLCTNWIENWKDVLKWENKIRIYDEFFLLFDESTCDGSYSCSSSGACMSAYGAASFSYPVSYSCTSSGTYGSVYDVATYFFCPVATDLVRWRVWDPGSVISREINIWRLGCSGSRYQ